MSFVADLCRFGRTLLRLARTPTKRPAARRRWVAAVALVAIATAWTPAHAATPPDASASEDTTILLLPIEVDGDVPSAQQREYLDHLRERLEDGSYRLLSPQSPSVAGALARCRSFRCESRVAANAGAHMMLRTRISARDRHYTLQLDLYEASSAKLLATSEEDCDLCGLGEMRDLVAARAGLVSQKIESLLRQSANITVRSVPDGAELTIDGEALGQTPAQLLVDPGEHRVEVTKPGYVAASKAVTVVRGVREIVEFELPAESTQARLKPPPRADRDDTRGLISRRGWGWLGTLSGAASLGTGITLLAIDERPFSPLCQDPANIDLNGTCRYRYNTATPGIVLSAVGGVLATTGVVLLIKTRRTTERPAVAVSTQGILFSLRF
ncbi:MAG: PEGA domain-containing protein [Myxococcales bacterium FL481]|nr:MAG: PEGA domain-containing protein [Myxococcales bacterium FL481]